MSTNLGPGLPPIILDPPGATTATLQQPAPPPATVVPVAGPLGPPGPPGPVGPPGPPGDGAAALAFTQTVNTPTTLVQLAHNLAFVPAGVLCIDTQGQIVEPAGKTDPQPGVTEITFGFGFTGQIQLS